MSFSNSCSIPFMTVAIAVTDVMPMTIPNVVKMDRSLFALIALNAVNKLSQTSRRKRTGFRSGWWNQKRTVKQWLIAFKRPEKKVRRTTNYCCNIAEIFMTRRFFILAERRGCAHFAPTSEQLLHTVLVFTTTTPTPRMTT